MVRALALSIALLCLSACRSSEPQATTKPDSPVPLELSGTYVHEGSGIAFPAAAAGFVRVAPKRYDRDGKDVGIGYRRFWTDTAIFRAEATIFVFPVPDGLESSLDGEFERVVDAARKDKDEFREVRRAATEGEHSRRSVSVRAAEFTFRGAEDKGGQAMVTIRASFLHSPWEVTYMLTVPQLRRDVCLAGFEELLRELDLPPTGLPVPVYTAAH